MHGIDKVSLRKISSEVGQKNKTAAQYHFGSKEELIEAIFAYRLQSLNAQRQQMLDDLLADGEIGLYKLIEVMLKPFVELLLDEEGGRHYVQFCAQLFNQGKGVLLVSKLHQKTPTHRHIFRLISEQLAHLPKNILAQRATFMSSLLVQASATKGYELESLHRSKRKRQISKFSHELIIFVVGGMSAPTT